LQEAAYPYPAKDPKFLGVVMQNFRPRKGVAAAGFQKWIDEIGRFVSSELFPILYENGMTLEKSIYEQVPDFIDSYYLAQIPDFNTLITLSQDQQTPIFALTDEQLKSVGAVLKERGEKREVFYELFSSLAEHIIRFTKD
jgi:hypothetical protein